MIEKVDMTLKVWPSYGHLCYGDGEIIFLSIA